MKAPLKVCLLLQGDKSWVGGIEYIKNIIFALSSLPGDVRSTFEVSLLCSKRIDPGLYDQITSRVKKIHYEEEALAPPTLINRIYWKLLGMLLNTYDSRYDDFFRTGHFDFIYPYFTRRSGPLPYKWAACIYDFQHKYLPRYFSKQDLGKRDRTFKQIARHAPVIVLNSAAAHDDFKKYFLPHAHKTRVLSFRTYPIPEWYEKDPLAAQKQYSLPDRFFLVSNQFWQHKNHMVIFNAMKLLRDRSVLPVIVCTGNLHDHRQKAYAEFIKRSIRELGLADQVHLLGLIPRIDQIQLMRRSLAVVQPSLFEGWSTVVEDARCLGKPIILSDIPVHKEQDPPRSTFFNKDSPEELAHCLGEWWERLYPGPNSGDEAHSRDTTLKEAEAYGLRFLDLARGVL